MEGEGTTIVLVFVAVLAAILIAVAAWQIIKKQRSVYTYAYQQQK